MYTPKTTRRYFYLRNTDLERVSPPCDFVSNVEDRRPYRRETVTRAGSLSQPVSNTCQRSWQWPLARENEGKRDGKGVGESV
jgi:hypothetical protein